MALEIARLCFIPFLFYNLDSDKHRGNVKFYKPILEYLLSAKSKKDYHVRLAIVNYTCCIEWAMRNKFIQCSIEEMDNDQQIDAMFIRPLCASLAGQHMDWMK